MSKRLGEDCSGERRGQRLVIGYPAAQPHVFRPLEQAHPGSKVDRHFGEVRAASCHALN
jgi:hypothetical protein